MADLTYLRSVLENLISNAIKFSNTEKEILLSVAEVDQQVQLRIRDHGPGVPVEEENKLLIRSVILNPLCLCASVASFVRCSKSVVFHPSHVILCRLNRSRLHARD